MLVDRYQSTLNPKKFLSVKAGEDVTKIVVPDPDYATVSSHANNVKLKAGEHRAALDSDEAMNHIEEHGYYLHSVSIQTFTTGAR